MSEVRWQEVECGSYTADFQLIEQLARRSSGDRSATVLDVGCGIGRVSLELARAGHRVTGLDSSAELLEELNRKASAADLEVETACGDARLFEFGRKFDLITAPMQLIQLLSGSAERRSFLRSTRRHMAPDGLCLIVLMDLTAEAIDDEYLSPLPDIREFEGVIYSSLPVAVRTFDRGRALALDRVRTVVELDGSTDETGNTIKLRLIDAETIEAEARLEKFEAVERIEIAPTDDHVGSVAVVLAPV